MRVPVRLARRRFEHPRAGPSPFTPAERQHPISAGAACTGVDELDCRRVLPLEARHRVDPKSSARAQIGRRNNKSGIAGVQLQIGYDGLPRAWGARTRVGGKEVREVFLISEQGKERAKALAITERQAQIAQAAERLAHLERSSPVCRHVDEVDG